MVTWQEVCENPVLRDLPYKIETNRFDQIVMSPAFSWHGGYQVEIATLLKQALPGGRVITECAVETTDGTKVPDVIWISKERHEPMKRAFSFHVAPEICVEVLSSSNSHEEMQVKMSLYFGAGAQEVWLCTEQGEMEFYLKGQAQPAVASVLCPAFPNHIEWD